MRANMPARLGALCLMAAMLNTAEAQVTFATLDADQFDFNGFTFGDFNDITMTNVVDTSGGVISLDINTDIDLANGLFGGAGSDVTAVDFDDTTTQLEVTVQVGALNVANDFRVVLIDNDGDDSGPGLGTEEFQYFFDISSLTPADGFVTLTQPLNAFVFRQQGFGSTFDGDTLTNYGLRQIQVQSAFGSPDRLVVDIESVKLVDPLGEPDPLIVELTPDTFATQIQNFAFGTFEDPMNPGQINPAVVDTSGGTFAIDTTQSADDGSPGGLGFNGINFDFEATEVMIELEAKLLPGNTADTLNLLMGDNDGDDSGPMMGSEDYIFTVPTSAFNETEFTTFQLPLGSGTESSIETTFGFANGGDGLQNFDLSQIQIQVDAVTEGGTGGGLMIEIARFSIVRITDTPIPGDANGDGNVDLLDLDILGANFGTMGGATFSDGDFNGDGNVDLLDLDILGGNFGFMSPASAVPEPTAGVLVALAACGLAARRRG